MSGCGLEKDQAVSPDGRLTRRGKNTTLYKRVRLTDVATKLILPFSSLVLFVLLLCLVTSRPIPATATSLGRPDADAVVQAEVVAAPTMAAKMAVTVPETAATMAMGLGLAAVLMADVATPTATLAPAPEVPLARRRAALAALAVVASSTAQATMVVEVTVVPPSATTVMATTRLRTPKGLATPLVATRTTPEMATMAVAVTPTSAASILATGLTVVAPVLATVAPLGRAPPAVEARAMAAVLAVVLAHSPTLAQATPASTAFLGLPATTFHTTVALVVARPTMAPARHPTDGPVGVADETVATRLPRPMVLAAVPTVTGTRPPLGHEVVATTVADRPTRPVVGLVAEETSAA